MNKFDVIQKAQAKVDKARLERDTATDKIIEAHHDIEKVITDPLFDIRSGSRDGISIADSTPSVRIKNTNLFLSPTEPPPDNSALRVSGDGSTIFGEAAKKEIPNLPRKPVVENRVHIHAQNVHDYFIDHFKDHGWEDLNTFFCVKPPFKNLLISYDHEFLTLHRIAVHVKELTVQDFSYYAEPDIDPEYRTLENQDRREQLNEFIKTVNPSSVLQIRIGIDAEEFPGRWFVFIDDKGKVLVYEPYGWVFVMSVPEMKRMFSMKVSQDNLQNTFCKHGAIALAAMQFMNCKNVEVVDNPPSRQQRRQAERDNKKPPVTYKTLVIHPMHAKRPPSLRTDPTNTTALHICRGHFKNYSQGEGLGRYHVKGIFWWSPQVRGSSDAGRVEKDYEVEPQ